MGIEPISKHFGGAGMQNSKNKTSNADRITLQIARPVVIAARRVLGGLRCG
jgi:hypothetical protein